MRGSCDFLIARLHARRELIYFPRPQEASISFLYGLLDARERIGIITTTIECTTGGFAI